MRQKPPGRRYATTPTDAVDVEVWTAHAGDWQAMSPLLSDDERDRAGQLQRKTGRDLYATAHAMLRSVLATRTGTSPRSVRVERAPCHRCGAPHGKPFLAGNPTVTFSISHSGGFAVAAVGSGAELGIDVEDLTKKRDAVRLAARTLSLVERAAFDASGEDPACFLRLWTRKEAVLKATGAGITQRLTGVAVPPMQTVVEFDGTWTLFDLDLPSRYVGTLAVEGTGAGVRLRRWTGPAG